MDYSQPILARPEVQVKVIRVHRTNAVLAILLVMSLASAASAQEFFTGIQGGFFQPWKGDFGGSAALAAGRKFNERHYFAGEFGYRDFEGRVFNIEIPVHSVQLRAVYRYDLLVDSPITPYVGAGIGVHINVFKGNKIERRKERGDPGIFVEAPSVGAGLDFVGLVGAEARIPGLDNVSFFTEARIGYAPQFSQFESTRPGHDDDEIDVDNLGGVSANAGFRIWY